MLNAQVITGKAFIEGKLIYIEKHYPVVNSNGSYKLLNTKYFYPDNDKNFAEVVSSFNKNLFVPDTTFQDNRLKLFENTSLSDNKMLTIKRTEDNKTETKSLEIDSLSVSGQGFHNFIVVHFDQLIKESKLISIVVTSKYDQYKFKVIKNKVKDNVVEFKIYPQNFLLRQIVEPIYLEYSLKNRNLLSFKGLSNLYDSKGNSQYVEIFYI